MEDGVGQRAGLVGYGEDVTLFHLKGFEPRIPQPLVSHYNDC